MYDLSWQNDYEAWPVCSSCVIGTRTGQPCGPATTKFLLRTMPLLSPFIDRFFSVVCLSQPANVGDAQCTDYRFYVYLFNLLVTSG